MFNLEIPKGSVVRIQGIPELGWQNITSLLSLASNWQLSISFHDMWSPSPTWDFVASWNHSFHNTLQGLQRS